MCKIIASEERGDARMGSKQTRTVWVAMPVRIPKRRRLMHFWLQSWRFRHLWICGLPRFSWLLNWCILLLCELWTWSDLLRHLLFTVRFLRKLSYSVLSHKYFFLIMFFLVWENEKSVSKVLWSAIVCIWHNIIVRLTDYILYGTHIEQFLWQDVTKWWLLATEDEVKQESSRKILGADQDKKKIPMTSTLMQSQLFVNKTRKLLRSQWLKENPFRPPVWCAYPSLHSL